MSCLINALLPSHLIGNHEAEVNADTHGGFEMGTWNYPSYLDCFCEALGMHPDWFKNPKTKNGKPWGYEYEFTATQCANIAGWLRGRRKTKNKKGQKVVRYDWTHDLNPREPMRLHLKWHNRLVDLFSSGKVTFYCR